MTIVGYTSTYAPPGAGAVATTVQAKLAQIVSVIDFGADPLGVADSAPKFTTAGSSAAVIEVNVPAGIFKLSSSPTPTGIVTWFIHSGATFTGPGVLPGTVIQQAEPLGALVIQRNLNASNLLGYSLLKLGIATGAEGGWTSNPATSNWVVEYPYISSFNGRSGAAPAGIWATNPIAEVKVNNDVACWSGEFDLNNDASNQADPGGALHKNGVSSVSGGFQKATAAFLASSRLTDGSNWWNHCYYGERAITYGCWMRQPAGDTLNAFAGAAFFDQSNSAVSFLVNSGSHTYAIDLNGGTYSSQAIRIPNNSGLVGRNAASSADLLIISLNASNNIQLGTAGGAANIVANASILPNSDNLYQVGATGLRFSVVWAANGTIQTSDPKLKTNIADLPSVTNLVKSLNPKTFQWKVGGYELVEIEEEQEVQATEEVTEEYEEIEVIGGQPTLLKKTRIKQRLLFDVLPVIDENGQPVMHKEMARLPDATGALIYQERVTARVHHAPRMVKKKVKVHKESPKPGKRTHWGFLATDVRDEFAKLGQDFGGYVLGEDGTHHLRPDQLIPVLWKAAQELQTQLAALQAEVAALKRKP
jgi:hypothetical protein